MKGLVFRPALVFMAVLVAAGCGRAPAVPPPISSAPASRATATAAVVVQSSATPALAASLVVRQSAVSTYSAEKTKELFAQGFYLPGMQYGYGQEPRYGGVATFGNRGDLKTADPMVFSGINNDNVLSPIYGDGGLIRAKSSNVFEVEPYVAQSWTVEDNFKTWTFKLRPGMKWHDGAPVTAEDVKFWIDLAVFPPAGRPAANNSADFGPLKEVQVIDALTVRLLEKEPVPHLLETMYRYSNVLSHPKHLAKPLIDTGNPKVTMNDIGWVSIGPFKFDSYQKGTSFRVVRSDNYFLKDAKGKPLPYLDAVYYPFIPDPTVGVSAFRAGRIDGTSRGTGHHLTPDMLTGVKKTLGDRAWYLRMPYTGWASGTNALKPPFDSLKLRRALNLYTDREEYIKLIFGGFAIESDLMVPGSYWADPTFGTWPGISPVSKERDRAEAKRLAREAGAEGMAVTISCVDVYLQNCEYLNLQLKGLGMAPKLEMMDQLRSQQVTSANNYEIEIATIGADQPDMAMLTFTTTHLLSQVKHGDTRIDDYHKQIVGAIDPIQRRNILWEAQKYLIQEKAYLQPWSREEAVVAYRTYIKGVWVPGTQLHYANDMADTWIDSAER